jgi:tetratricopeptide (TPR) repeat protein
MRASWTLGSINHQLRRGLAASDVSSLVAGIAKLAASAGIIHADDAGVPQVLANVAQAMQVIARNGAPDQIEAVIAACRQAAASTPNQLIKAPFQGFLGILLGVRFDRTKNLADLDAAMTAFQEAADCVPETDPARAVYLGNLAKLQGGRAMLAEAEREDERDEHFWQTVLESTDLVDQGIRQRDPAMLTAALERLRQALELAPADDSRRPAIISEIGTALRHRFELTGARVDLDGAVDMQRQAVAAAPLGDTGSAAYLTNLANTLLLRFKVHGASADLSEASEASRQAVGSCPAGDPGRATVLSSRGLVLLEEYRHGGSLNRLDEAVTSCQEAVEAAPDETGRAPCRMNLGLALTTRFERKGYLADADAAVKATGQALDAAGPANPDRVNYLTSHAGALRLRGEWTGSLEDIRAAVEDDEQAVAVSAPGGLGYAMRLSHLGIALLRRYLLTGTLADLDAAVDRGNKSVMAATDGDPFRALCFSNLSCSLLRRFQQNGALADLNAAVDAAQEAADLVAETDPMRPRSLGNLANVLEARFIRLADFNDLDRAIDAAQQAVAVCPDDDANRGSYLNSLANALQLRFRRTAQSSDLDESIDCSRQALAAIPRGYALRGLALAALSLGLIFRFLRGHAKADLDDAVDAGRQAVKTAALNDPSLVFYLSRTLLALYLRFGLTGDQADLNEALEAGRKAAATMTAPPSVRAGAAVLRGHLAATTESWTEAVNAYQMAIDLLGKVAPRGLARGDQEYQLIGISGIGSRAAACCLELGQTDRAVELLEQGRGVLLGQALDTQADLTSLVGMRPDLAARFVQLRDELDAAWALGGLGQQLAEGTSPSANAAASRMAERQRQVAESLEAVITEARSLPGLERFLLPLRVDELLKAAEQGPIVMITVDEIRSDALVLTPSGVQVVPLPGLSARAVVDHTTQFLGALAEIRAAAPAAADGAEARLSAELGWLWDTVAGPVLDRLGCTGTPPADQPWPRIWWCPSGLLSLLPLHAAGYHETRSAAIPQTVIDRVAPSYAATARTLLYARRPAPTEAAAPSGQVLVVAMARTFGAPDLDAAPEEAGLLTEKFGLGAKVLHDQADAAQATYESVLDAMPGYPWAHFACHATGRLRDPSASYLLLSDHAEHPMTVLDVARLRLQQAELAYLSACSTAMTGAVLPDEAINLASAFQLAGYRRVVATLWPVDDDLAASLARRFYSTVSSPGTQDAAASALHAASRIYRKVYAEQPSMWAAHIHSGI